MKRDRFQQSLVMFLLFLLLFISIGNATAQEVKRSITQVSGDLYRFQNNFHVSVFLVTDAGVIATDPINAEAAKWLKEEVMKRFNKEIKYVIYSHDHRDHIAGGEVLADTATVISHQRAKEVIIGEKRPTAIPEITFTDTLTVELGGKEVNLIYPGKSHSDNLIVIHFPEQRAVFTVDFISVNRVGFKDFPDAYFPDWIDAIKVVEGIDFDTVIPGHGPNGTKADVAAHREYLEALYNGVLAGLRAGKSPEEIKSTLELSKYKSFGMFDQWGPMNIDGMIKQVSMHRRGN